MELGEEVEDVERHPAEGEDQGDGSQQQVRLPLPATAPLLLAVPGLVGRLSGGGAALSLLLLLLLVDHAVAELVADAEVGHGEDDERKDVLYYHLSHRVRPLLHLHFLVLWGR